jgi:hypothetical protein
LLGEFEQYAAGAAGVQESNEMATGATPWALADGFHAGSATALERRLDIGDFERDVMQAWAASLEKTADGRLVGGRLEKFDPRPLEVEESDLYLFRLDNLASRVWAAEDRRKDRDGRLEIVHGDGDVFEMGAWIHWEPQEEVDCSIAGFLTRRATVIGGRA